MAEFDYVMVLISILIGLGLTHMLSVLAQAIPPMAKQAQAIQLHPVFLGWFAYVFLYLISFWWFEFEWRSFAGPWKFNLYLMLIIYATLLYALAVILVPARVEDLRDTLGHFLSVRRWFFVVLLGAGVVDVIDSLWKDVGWGADPGYWAFNVGLVTACVIGWRTVQPRTHTTIAAVMLVWQLGFILVELDVLGVVR